jgi:hypothetical protein
MVIPHRRYDRYLSTVAFHFPTLNLNLSVSEIITQLPSAAAFLAISTCLCMSCALSVKDGTGLGTLGFSIPVAEKMLKEGGFEHVQVLLEKDNVRWFLVK